MNWIASVLALALAAITVAAVSDARFTTCKSRSVYAIVGLCTPAAQ